ncbi:MAG TPA: molybdopterin-dependent oxidoreductase [Candidatus Dormibacteraeota bacterium]|nr:molybdopterin-dependent oxidoreductase [Candidatus Dormibacteraeota bacterium]
MNRLDPGALLWPAIAGLTAGAVSLGVSELAAGVLPRVPSLVVAVGDEAIALQPPGAKDVMVQLFGTNDKLALNLLVVAGVLGFAAIAGVLAARRFAAGAALFGVFGLVAAVVAMGEVGGSPPGAVIGAGLAVAAGLVALRAELSIRPGRVGPRVAAVKAVAAVEPSRSDPWDRRRFLIASAGTIAAVGVAGGVGRSRLDAQHPTGVVTSSRLPRAMVAAPPLAADAELAVPGISPLVTSPGAFYRIDTTLLTPAVDVGTWKLEVKGMVDHPLTFDYDQLLAMPLYEQYVTISCVSNEVGGHLVGNALWTGVRLKEVLAAAGVQPGATQVVGRSVDDFTVGFPTAWAMAPEREPLIAVGMDGQPLPAAHGFPARLIVPGLYGYVSATKWLASIELTTREAVDGYWIPLGWAKDGPILTQSRIDVPADGATLAAGAVAIGGIAWAPDRGVERVEVRVDGGDWRPTTVSRAISRATWVQWTTTWAATPGRHTIEVRATDGTGVVQTDEVTRPAPDGARGHHMIGVLVR